MFNEHGGYNITVRGNILFLEITGAWNAETAKSYAADLINTVDGLTRHSFGLITDVTQWELCTPECEQLIINLWADCAQKGLFREAIVNHNVQSIKLEMFNKHMEKEQPTKPPHVFQRRIFCRQDEALQWLHEEGYSQTDQ